MMTVGLIRNVDARTDASTRWPTVELSAPGTLKPRVQLEEVAVSSRRFSSLVECGRCYRAARVTNRTTRTTPESDPHRQIAAPLGHRNLARGDRPLVP